MATYNLEINTDAGTREEGLQHVVALHNAAAFEREEPSLDALNYLQLTLNSAIDSYANLFAASEARELKEKFAVADEATKDAVRDALMIEKPVKETAETDKEV